ncbi:Phosphoserine transaminase [Emydomyces testavorans]|uniref:phosphoserine transaminase n=1 Tax=Emydomyces testavorans TaxID=2070801 RepID=A0AAF0IQJ5_9EURO|nr:Phosphoserine transaminase [Emydomyces testavorans]
MPSRSEVAYFGAGPAPLPTSVVEAAAKAFVNFNDSGLGLGEISHRSPTANKILAEAKEALTTLLDVPDNYETLFMQAGGSGEFSAVVHNLVGVWVERRRRKINAATEEDVVVALKKQVEEELKLDYIVTGSWSLKAYQEAVRLLGDKYVNVAVDARKDNEGKFGKIPAEDTWKLTKTQKEGGKAAPAFVYFCDNETVDGVEFPDFPKILEPHGGDKEDERIVVADMSSNFLSRKAGAQKNIGVAGITVLIVRKDLLPPQTASPLPSLLRQLNLGGLPGPIVFDYATIAKNNSLYNTLPIFNLWVAGQVMINLVTLHGAKKVSGQEEVANTKAQLIYGALEKYPHVYTIVPDKSVRSRMNICFRVYGGDADKEKEFSAGAEKRLLQGLKGHRSVGGMRASSYNAVSLENVERLVQYLEDYANGRV